MSSINFQIKGIDKFSQTFKKLRASTNAVSKDNLRAINKMKASLGGLNRQMEQLSTKRMRSFQNAVVGAFATKGAFDFIKPAVEFESKMDGVRSKMTGFQGSLSNLSDENKKLFEEMKDKAKELGATTVKKTSEVADGMYYLASAGLTAKQSIESIGAVTNLSIAGGVDMKEASDIATDIGTAFFGKDGLAGNMNKLADGIAYVAAKTNTDIIQIGEGMKFVAPIAGKLGFSFEDSASAMGILANSGLKSTIAGTGLRKMLLALAGPTAGAKQAMEELGVSTEEVVVIRDKMDTLGIKSKDSTGKQKSMVEIFKDLNKSLKNMESSKAAAIIKDIFGTTATGQALTLFKGIDDGSFDKLSKEILGAEGAAKMMAITMSDNSDGAMKAFGSAIEAVRISIGDLFLEDLKNLFQGLAKIALSFRIWIKENKTLVKIIAIATVAITGLFTAFSILGVGIYTAQIGLVGIQAVMLATKLKAISMWGAITLPVALVVAGIAAVGAGVYLLYKHWDTVKEGATSFFNYVFPKIKYFISNFTPIGIIATAIYNNFDKIKNKIGEVFGWIANKYNTYIKPIFDNSVISGLFGSVNFPDESREIQKRKTEFISNNKSQSTVDVNFSNAPKGTSVDTKSTGSDLRYSLGEVF